MMKPDTRLFAATAVLFAVTSTPTFAADGKKYCLNPSSGGSSCSFTSMEQCKETMWGRNGWCSEQVDFDAWAASHGQNWSGSNPANSFAYYQPGGKPVTGKTTQERDMEKLHKDNMPSKGVGAE
jgi:hypothetical protein